MGGEKHYQNRLYENIFFKKKGKEKKLISTPPASYQESKTGASYIPSSPMQYFDYSSRFFRKWATS